MNFVTNESLIIIDTRACDLLYLILILSYFHKKIVLFKVLELSEILS